MERESEKLSIRDPMMDDTKNTDDSTNNKHKKIIIIAVICAVVIVALGLTLFFVLRDDSDEEKKDDSIPECPECGLSMEELKQRTDPKYLGTIKLLEPDSPEYAALDQKDKEALKYIVKAATYLENIEFQIDDSYNIPFKKYLEEQIQKNNEQAKLTKILFDAQKGINALDSLSHEINLAKGHKTKPGIGVYPEDLTAEEYQRILIKMLKENKTEEVRNITNQRSMVFRDGEYLKAIDYVEYFKEDFTKIADELDKAAECSTDANFTEYLKLQSKALRTADPMLDAYADKKWAELEYTPLELTITRENYEDTITSSYSNNQELIDLLSAKNITPVPKDCLGFRVGIVNKEGTDFLLRIKQFLPELAKNMPYSDEYEQDVTNGTIKQTMVDADLIILAGDVGAYRAGITLAENLPNDDKPSLTIGGGRRNVYHRQIRASNATQVQKKLDLILDQEQHQYYDTEADHWFTIGHENCHSLGPNILESRLGQYRSIVEENKADMGGLAFTNNLTNLGYYTEEQRKKIIVTVVVDNFLKVKPDLSQAHRVRTVMQNYYLKQHGAYTITEDGKIHVNIEEVVPAAYDMLKEIIRIQLDNKFEKAEEYVNKYFIWTDEMKIIGDKLQTLSATLNSRVENELADKILSEY
jgi:hypothetical protein